MIPRKQGGRPDSDDPTSPELRGFLTWQCCSKATGQWKTDIWRVSLASGSWYTNPNKVIACYNIFAGGCVTLAPGRQKVCRRMHPIPNTGRLISSTADPPVDAAIDKHNRTLRGVYAPRYFMCCICFFSPPFSETCCDVPKMRPPARLRPLFLMRQ